MSQYKRKFQLKIKLVHNDNDKLPCRKTEPSGVKVRLCAQLLQLRLDQYLANHCPYRGVSSLINANKLEGITSNYT